MKISLDAGALCTNNRFGNYIFTSNLIRALCRYDKTNEYFLYSFCRNNQEFKKLPINFRHELLRPKKFWLSLRVSIEEYLKRKAIFLGLNQALPLYTKAKIISFSHGLSYYFYPELYPDSSAVMKKQLETVVRKSDAIIVSSIKVKKEFMAIYPRLKKIEVVPFGIPYDMTQRPEVHPERGREKYFLYVGMNHPIKNIAFIRQCFSEFAKKLSDNYRLYVVSDQNQYDINDPSIKVMQINNRDRLRKLYQNATALLTASLYESFNLPVLEALSQDCQVIGLDSAIIPEFRKYVHCVSNKKEFVDKMIKIAKGERININHKKLHHGFSWKNYINQLINLYCYFRN